MPALFVMIFGSCFHPVQRLGVYIFWGLPTAHPTPSPLESTSEYSAGAVQTWPAPYTGSSLGPSDESREEMWGHRDLFEGPHDLQGAEAGGRTAGTDVASSTSTEIETQELFS